MAFLIEVMEINVMNPLLQEQILPQSVFHIQLVVFSRIPPVVIEDGGVHLCVDVHEIPPVCSVETIRQSLQVNRAVPSPLQLTFICPAVAPEHVGVCGNVAAGGQSIAAVRLQVPVLLRPLGARQTLWHAVSLDKEEFGFPRQHGAGIGGEQPSDVVHQHTPAILVRAKEVVCTSTANDAADKSISSVGVYLFECLSESGQSVGGAQPPVEDDAEVKIFKGLLQHFSVVSHTVYDHAYSSGIGVKFVPIWLNLTPVASVYRQRCVHSACNAEGLSMFYWRSSITLLLR